LAEDRFDRPSYAIGVVLADGDYAYQRQRLTPHNLSPPRLCGWIVPVSGRSPTLTTLRIHLWPQKNPPQNPPGIDQTAMSPHNLPRRTPRPTVLWDTLALREGPCEKSKNGVQVLIHT